MTDIEYGSQPWIWLDSYDPATNMAAHNNGHVAPSDVTPEQRKALLDGKEIELYGDGVLYSDASLYE